MITTSFAELILMQPTDKTKLKTAIFMDAPDGEPSVMLPDRIYIFSRYCANQSPTPRNSHLHGRTVVAISTPKQIHYYDLDGMGVGKDDIARNTSCTDGSACPGTESNTNVCFGGSINC